MKYVPRNYSKHYEILQSLLDVKPLETLEYFICTGIVKSKLDKGVWDEESAIKVGVIVAEKSMNYGNYGIRPYSAYYDDRPILNGSNYIRIITTILGRISANAENFDFFCHIWLDRMEHPISVPAEAETIWPYFGSIHGAMFSCKIPPTLMYNSKIVKEIIPKEVTIVDNICGEAGHILPVQKRPSKERTDKVAVCSKAIYGSPNPVKVVEWIELNRLLGAEMIYMYDVSLKGVIKNILKYYHDKGIIYMKKHDYVQKLSQHVFKQNFPTRDYNQNWELEIVSMNDCLYFAKERYIVNIDIDEILQPITHDTFQQFVDVEYKQLGMNASNAKFKTGVFTDEFGVDKTSSSPEYLHTMRYRTRTEIDFESPKSIVDFQRCKAVGHHVCLKVLNNETRHIWDVPVGHGYVRHYRHKCRLTGEPNKCQKLLNKPYIDTNLDRYKTQLNEKVLPILKKFKLV